MRPTQRSLTRTLATTRGRRTRSPRSSSSAPSCGSHQTATRCACVRACVRTLVRACTRAEPSPLALCLCTPACAACALVSPSVSPSSSAHAGHHCVQTPRPHPAAGAAVQLPVRRGDEPRGERHSPSLPGSLPHTHSQCSTPFPPYLSAGCPAPIRLLSLALHLNPSSRPPYTHD